MTPKQQLASIKMGRPVLPWIVAQREAGNTWERIARDLETLAGIAVTAEAIRQWHNDAKKSAA